MRPTGVEPASLGLKGRCISALPRTLIMLVYVAYVFVSFVFLLFKVTGTGHDPISPD